MFVPTITPNAPVTLLAGVDYGRAGDTPLLLDLLLPQTDELKPATIWLHGGGWYGGSRESGPTYWCAQLAANGFVTASVDYRLSGDAPFPAQIDDVQTAIRWLRTHADELRVDPDRIGIWGHSAGGHLAALAAVTGEGSSAVQAAVIGSASSDFLDHQAVDDCEPAFAKLFGGDPTDTEDLRRLASPLYQVRPGTPPFLIAHGTLDETVPFDQAKRLHDALQTNGVPVELVTIEGGYHNWNPKPDSTWPKVRYFELAQLALDFFQRTL